MKVRLVGYVGDASGLVTKHFLYKENTNNNLQKCSLNCIESFSSIHLFCLSSTTPSAFLHFIGGNKPVYIGNRTTDTNICVKQVLVPRICHIHHCTQVTGITLKQAKSPLYESHRYHSDSESESDHKHKRESESDKKVIMQKPELSEQLKHSKEEALYGFLIADAVAMPVHWYYNTDDIKHDYGDWLKGYQAPNKQHPSSILNLSAVDGSGRGGGSSTPLIGNVILHDKLEYWQSGNSTHYHQGMQAGDNTLNAIMAIEILKTMNKFDSDLIKPERDVRAAVLEDYVQFMTTPGTHNDTYAESFHRAFFRDWVMVEPRVTKADQLIQFAEERSKEKLSAKPDSQLLVIGSLVLTIPWILRNAHKTEAECAKAAVDFIRLTHPVASLFPFVEMYARLLHAALNGHDLKAEVLKVLSHSMLGGPQKRQIVLDLLDEAHKYPKGSEDRLKVYQSGTSSLGSACYIEGAISSMLFLALEFHDDFQGGILTNANCGGENCHRGAALGALLGAAAARRGEKIPPLFKDNLHSLKSSAETVAKAMNQA